MDVTSAGHVATWHSQQCWLHWIPFNLQLLEFNTPESLGLLHTSQTIVWTIWQYSMGALILLYSSYGRVTDYVIHVLPRVLVTNSGHSRNKQPHAMASWLIHSRIIDNSILSTLAQSSLIIFRIMPYPSPVRSSTRTASRVLNPVNSYSDPVPLQKGISWPSC